MLTEWGKRYSRNAARSTVLSQLGAFVILVIALIESVSLFRAILTAEDVVSLQAVTNAAIPVGLFLFAFGVRFILFFRYASFLVIRTISWWLIVLTVEFCSARYGPEPGTIYDIFSSFPLVTSGTLFLVAGSVRFVYFATISLKNDVSSNS